MKPLPSALVVLCVIYEISESLNKEKHKISSDDFLAFYDYLL